MKTCLIPGSFDPFTIGHYRIAMAASQLFPFVVIGVAKNPNKHESMFSVSTRVKMIEASVAGYKNIKVVHYDCATVTFCAENNIEFIVRGCRNGSEFDSELINKCINDSLSHKTVETIIIPTDPTVSYISSSLVRECINQNLDKWKSYVVREAVPILEQALAEEHIYEKKLTEIMGLVCNKT